jgi:hypothetical protein
MVLAETIAAGIVLYALIMWKTKKDVLKPSQTIHNPLLNSAQTVFAKCERGNSKACITYSKTWDDDTFLGTSAHPLDNAVV